MSMQLSVSLKLAWVMQLVQHHLLIPGLCHILVKQGAVWLQYRISPLIFNFLLVYVTALTLLKPNPMWLPGAEQPFPRAGELHSRGWQGPCSAPSLPSSLCTQGTFGITLRALGMDGPGGNGNIQEKAEAVVWREPYPFGAMYLSQKGTGAWLQHVLYKPQDSVRMTVIFCCFGFFFHSHWQNC